MTLGNWLFQLCDSESPDESIIAYDFGLFETPNGFAIYLIGSKEFDEDSDDWACNNDFEPKDKYFYLQSTDYENLIGDKVLDKIVSELTRFSKSAKFKESFFSRAQVIATGFDSGDLIRIL